MALRDCGCDGCSDLRCGTGHRAGHGSGDLGCGARRHLRDSRCDLRGEGGGLALRDCGCGCRCDLRCGIGNKRGGRSSRRSGRLGRLGSDFFDRLDNRFLPLLGGLLDGFLLLGRELARSGSLGLRRAFEGIRGNGLRHVLRVVLRRLHVLIRAGRRRGETALRREARALAGAQALCLAGLRLNLDQTFGHAHGILGNETCRAANSRGAQGILNVAGRAVAQLGDIEKDGAVLDFDFGDRSGGLVLEVFVIHLLCVEGVAQEFVDGKLRAGPQIHRRTVVEEKDGATIRRGFDEITLTQKVADIEPLALSAALEDLPDIAIHFHGADFARNHCVLLGACMQ